MWRRKMSRLVRNLLQIWHWTWRCEWPMWMTMCFWSVALRVKLFEQRSQLNPRIFMWTPSMWWRKFRGAANVWKQILQINSGLLPFDIFFAARLRALPEDFSKLSCPLLDGSATSVTYSSSAPSFSPQDFETSKISYSPGSNFISKASLLPWASDSPKGSRISYSPGSNFISNPVGHSEATWAPKRLRKLRKFRSYFIDFLLWTWKNLKVALGKLN